MFTDTCNAFNKSVGFCDERDANSLLVHCSFRLQSKCCLFLLKDHDSNLEGDELEKGDGL